MVILWLQGPVGAVTSIIYLGAQMGPVKQQIYICKPLASSSVLKCIVQNSSISALLLLVSLVGAACVSLLYFK